MKMADDKHKEIIAEIKAKYDKRLARGTWRYGKWGSNVSLEQADKEYQTAHKDRITLPRVAWLRRPAPEASPVPRSALISPQSGATLIGSAKSRRRI